MHREPTGGLSVPDSASAKLWDSASPELRRRLADAGVYLPGTKEWTELSGTLLLSTTDHVFFILPLPDTSAYRDSLPEFAIEITLVIPTLVFFKVLRSNSAKKVSTDKWEIKRTRMFRFDHKVRPEDLAVLRGFVDERTPRPYIETFWHQGEIIDISMFGLFEVAPPQRAERAALLSAGLELLNAKRDEKKIKKLITAIMTATIKKQWGGARRKPKDFTPEVCKQFKKKTDELQPLWNSIIEFFQKEEYDAGCVRAVKELDWFKELLATCTRPVPEDLLKRVFERERTGRQKYWPRTFALLHARFELGITTDNKISTLHSLYYKGNKLLKESGEPNAHLKDIPR